MRVKTVYLFVSMLICSWGCDTEVGFLDTEYATYDPDVFEVRNLPLFQEEQEWSLDEFWDFRETLPEELEDAYLEEWSKNGKHYERETDWISTNLQGISGTYPIYVTLHDVTSPTGGDAVLFKSLVKMRGDGTLELPANVLPEGIFMLSMKVENEDHVSIVSRCITVKVIGAPGSFMLTKE